MMNRHNKKWIVYNAITEGITLKQLIEKLQPPKRPLTPEEYHSTASDVVVRKWVKALILEEAIVNNGGKLFKCL